MNDPLIAVRAVYFIAALQLFGLLLFALVFARWQPAGTGWRRPARALAGVILLAMILRLALVAAGMSGEPLAQTIADGTLVTVLRETRFGHVWVIRVGLFAAAALALAWHGRTARLAASAAAGIALALTALIGHAGAMPGLGGSIHLAADMVHLCTAAAWLGGLLPFAAILARREAPERAFDAAKRFSLLGTVCVGLILATGIVNSWFLVGTVSALVGTLYGHVLLVKLALFLAMVTVAAINRFQLTPWLAAGDGLALSTLRRNAMIETAVGAAILVVVGVLGTLPPAYGMTMMMPEGG